MGEAASWKCPECTYETHDPVPCPTHWDKDLIHPWAAFQVVDIDPRQNGKSEIEIARELAGLFIIEEPLQIYSAHLFDTAMEIFLRLETLIINCDDLRCEVKHRGGKMVGIKHSHGEEGIELKGGQRIRFKARTGSGGRGFSCDRLALDEAMILPERFLGATVPTLSAMPNPQLWLYGSAPDQEEPTHDGIVLAKLRKRALKGGDKKLCYFERSADFDGDPNQVPDEVLDDHREWARANPALGRRISETYIESERLAMGARQFAVERLGITLWPQTETGGGQKITVDAWRALTDRASHAQDPVCFSFDVTPDRAWASIAVAGDREDNLGHVEMIEHRRATNWLVDRLVELALKHDPVAIVWDTRSPANSLESKLRTELEDAGVQMKVGDEDLLVPVGAADLASACGMLFDEVESKTFRHGDQQELADAIKGATARVLGDEAWIWSRKSSAVDISPLVAVTLARWGHQTHQPPERVPMVAFR